MQSVWVLGSNCYGCYGPSNGCYGPSNGCYGPFCREQLYSRGSPTKVAKNLHACLESSGIRFICCLLGELRDQIYLHGALCRVSSLSSPPPRCSTMPATQGWLAAALCGLTRRETNKQGERRENIASGLRRLRRQASRHTAVKAQSHKQTKIQTLHRLNRGRDAGLEVP